MDAGRGTPTPPGLRFRLVAGLVAAVVLLAGCEQEAGVVDPPAGDPMLPDLVATPAEDLRVTVDPDSEETLLLFSSVLVNTGEGDFLVRASRDGEVWSAQQEIPHTLGGAELETLDIPLVWGGDGHEHWHIGRVADYRLVPVGGDGEPLDEELAVDTKVGFCFFDSRKFDESAPTAVYTSETCGKEDDTLIRMGLSSGWGDVYTWALPGQSVDITGLPAGTYRLVGTVDTQGWFVEADRANNESWVEFEYARFDDGAQYVRMTRTSDDA